MSAGSSSPVPAAVSDGVHLAAAAAGAPFDPAYAFPVAAVFALAAAFFVSAEVAVTRSGGMETEPAEDDSPAARRLRRVLAELA
ncbi:hypothetical protein ACFQZ2_08690, partial [Streptomonospora algeriensis]